MIVAFDLDDTLYDERTYVASGFRAVADALADRWGVDAGEAVAVMDRSLETYGRGRQFDDAVRHFDLGGRQSIRPLVDVYRRLQQPVSSFPTFLTYVMFWPQLVAGPVLRAHEVLPQLQNHRRANPGEPGIEMTIWLSPCMRRRASSRARS